MHRSVTLKLRLALLWAHSVCTGSVESFRIPSGKVRVVGHGIDTHFFTPDPSVERGLHALSVGRLMQSKRHDIAIRKAYEDGRELYIAGEGTERANLEALAKELGAKVVFLGPLTHEQLRVEYQKAAYLIHTSETGSLDKVVLEALACGLPIRTDDPALNHLESESAEYVRKKHSLTTLIPRLVGILEGKRPSVAYLFTGTNRKEVLLQVARGEVPDTSFLGFNHLERLGVDTTLLDSGAAAPWPWLAKYAPSLDRLRWVFVVAWRCRSYDAVVSSSRLQIGVILRLLRALHLRPRHSMFIYIAIDVSVVIRRGVSFFKRLGFRCVDMFVCINTQQMHDLQTIGISPQRLHFAHYGVDISWWGQVYSLGTNQYVLGVGADAGRDWNFFIEVAREVAHPFVIATTKESKLPEAIPPTVRVMRGLGPKEVRELYQNATTLFLAAHDDMVEKGSDCSGQTVVLEAMTVGVPVVMSRKAWQPDYVTEVKDALVVAPGDKKSATQALGVLISGSDPAVLERVAHAQNTASHFSTEAFAQSVFSLLPTARS